MTCKIANLKKLIFTTKLTTAGYSYIYLLVRSKAYRYTKN